MSKYPPNMSDRQIGVLCKALGDVESAGMEIINSAESGSDLTICEEERLAKLREALQMFELAARLTRSQIIVGQK